MSTGNYDQDVLKLTDEIVVAVGNYLEKYRSAAPKPLLDKISALWSFLVENRQLPAATYIQGVSDQIVAVLTESGNEIRKLEDSLRNCRLYNLRQFPGKREAPTLEFFRTGKTDPNKELCTKENMTTIKNMRDKLINMELDLLGCTKTKLLLEMLKLLGLEKTKDRLERICLRVRFRNVQTSNLVCASCGVSDPKNVCGKCLEVVYCNQDCADDHYSLHKLDC